MFTPPAEGAWTLSDGCAVCESAAGVVGCETCAALIEKAPAADSARKREARVARNMTASIRGGMQPEIIRKLEKVSQRQTEVQLFFSDQFIPDPEPPDLNNRLLIGRPDM